MEILNIILSNGLRPTVIVLMFALGLSLTPAEIIAPWRKGNLWLRALLAVVILPPVIAICTVALLPEESSLGLVLLGLAAAPCAPRVGKRVVKAGGKLTNAVSLQVALGILSVVTIPLWTEIYGIIFSQEFSADPISIAKIVAQVQLIPIVIGLLIRKFQPGYADKIEGIVSKAANILILVIILGILILLFPVIIRIGFFPFLVLIPVVAIWVTLGHFLGGPTLAIGSVARNVGLVLLFIKLNNPPEQIVEKFPVVLAFILVGAIGGFVYSKLSKQGRSLTETEENNNYA